MGILETVNPGEKGRIRPFVPIRLNPRGNPLPLIWMPGGMELLVIALILLLLFGGTKIPALMRGMGQGIREFRKEVHGSESTEESPSEKTEPKEGP